MLAYLTGNDVLVMQPHPHSEKSRVEILLFSVPCIYAIRLLRIHAVVLAVQVTGMSAKILIMDSHGQVNMEK
jgi:hypothetical protein